MDRPAPGLCQNSKGYHGWWSLEAEATVPPRDVQFTAWKPNCGSFPEFLLRSSLMGKGLPRLQRGAALFPWTGHSLRGMKRWEQDLPKPLIHSEAAKQAGGEARP